MPTAFGGTLTFGVEGGKITDPFYRNPEEKKQVSGRSGGRAMHPGIDVSLSNASGGGADDTRRGLPVFVSLKPSIDVGDLNAVAVLKTKESGPGETGLGIPGSGAATLQDARVHPQPWDQPGDAYGGVVGLSARYSYVKTDGSPGSLVLYVEWLHLITDTYLPQDGTGRVMSRAEWDATGKGIGFGPEMQAGRVLTSAELTQDPPLLIGYFGATKFPHTHIQATLARSQAEKPFRPRFNPTVVVA
ncbi:MAG TPA: hypothetical protein VJT68_08830 [Thermoleophilaceae bacterium]|nr:hypothetical protein [Thermoleophilaceae bacterium]